MAQPEPFSERLEALSLYRERFCIAFPAGHHLEQKNQVEIGDVAGETYLGASIASIATTSRTSCERAASASASGFRASAKTGFR